MTDPNDFPVQAVGVGEKICAVCREPFVAPFWYHCPRCGRHGFASIHRDACTDCSNHLMSGTADPVGWAFTKEELKLPAKSAYAKVELGGVMLHIHVDAPGATSIKFTFETEAPPLKYHYAGSEKPERKMLGEHADWCNTLKPIHEDGDCNCWFPKGTPA